MSIAQYMSRKEASGINNLLKDVSERHQPNTYNFKNVNVLTMLTNEIEEQDVLIENGIIKEIGTNVNHPAAIEIDGKGKYLMPGLTDMHIHIFDEHQMKNTWMLLLLVNGVTSVRDMAGEPDKLLLKEKIKNSQVLAPNIYQAGPIINGIGNHPKWVVTSTPEDGERIVIEQKESGFDFIKVYNDLDRDVYRAIVNKAAKEGMPVVGHVPNAIPLEQALVHQSTIEHLTGYLGWRNRLEVYLRVDDEYAQKTARSHAWNCPTLFNLMMNWGGKEEAEELLADFDEYLPDRLSNKWKYMLNKNVKEKEKMVTQHGETNRLLFSKTVLNLYQADAKLIAGTDAGSLPLMVPGFSFHKELSALNKIGIPIYNVLKMATFNAALAMRKEEEFGTIEIGKRADLLLLDHNPLVDINNLKTHAGIMVRGIWLSKDELEEIKLKIRTIFGKQ